MKKKATGESLKDILFEKNQNKNNTSKTIKQYDSIPASQHNSKKVTYYIKKPELIKELKKIAIDKERDLSSLVTEAIEDLIRKYSQ